MPFPKFNFKKSRQQYNVASKSVFVLTVELLDSAVLECTLSAESTGRDCMDNVCQRLSLQQPDLFGLKYVSRRSYPKIRWVDLDRPLKKQLDKYSTEPYLYLGVIFYVTDVSLLEDEVTRYHYFLQLKTDVVEGRLRCNHEQAIVLASYSLQAEFGDHDPEKHTAEYLKDFPLLPKPLVSQFEDRLGALTDPVVAQHASLAGIAQQLAEIYYIVGAQQLEGYGQECFLAKDDAGNEVLLGASLIGICVRKSNGQSPQFKWSNITNLVNHKRYFGIECQDFEYSVQFVFDEPEAAKYVWKMCVLQHTFYKMHQSATESSELNITLSPSTPSLPNHDMDYSARSSVGLKHADIANFQRQSQNIPARVELQAGTTRGGSSLLSKSTDPTVSSYSVSRPGTRGVQQGRRMGAQHQGREGGGTKQGKGRKAQQGSLTLGPGDSFAPGEISRLSGARSTNDIDQLSRTAPPVPSYRPAPDYETAVLSKYGPTQPLAQLYSSHPQLLAPPLHHYPLHPSTPPDLPGLGLTSHTYSTPELTNDDPPAPLSLYKPPPPYPGHADLRLPGPMFSSSTPDLASQTLGHTPGQVGGSSPDLVSRRTLGPAAHAHTRVSVSAAVSPGQEIHRTYDNLANYGEQGPEYRTRAYSQEKDLPQAHLIQNIINESYNPQLQQNYIYEQQLLQHPQQVPSHLPAHLSQLDTGQLSGLVPPTQSEEGGGEPIYQNQGQILLQQYEEEQVEAGGLYPVPGSQTGPGEVPGVYPEYLGAVPGEEGGGEYLGGGGLGEPIYQNLPLLEKLQLQAGGSDSDSIQPDDTVDGISSSGRLIEGALPEEGEEVLRRLVSRVGITSSREDLSEHLSKSRTSLDKIQEPRRRLEMRQYLEPAVPQNNIQSLDESLINTVNASSSISHLTNSNRLSVSPTPHISPPHPSSPLSPSPSHPTTISSSSSLRKKSSTSSVCAEEVSGQQQGRSKGRKRWGLNMAVKSGSLKSTKSDKSDGGSKSGEEGGSRQSSGRGMGAMMLANLHGLTRSRPDILSDSVSFTGQSRIPKESIGNYLESKLVEGEVVREFERIPKKKTVGYNVSVASMAENVPRNRFKDVVPYDENRVKISNDKDNKFGYVNASHISATVGDSQRFYIAAQGPMANTVHNFWSMVQECDVHLIVMLTEVSGASKASASIPYWPQNDGSSLELGEFTITKKFSSNSDSYTTTTLQLTHGPSKKTRRVWHLQYCGWQDHGCPEQVGEYLTFMEELSALRRHTVSEVAAGKNRNTPVLVHCSAGVGRTGVTILSDILRYCADHNIDIDIPKVLTHLRQQRMLMVQTVAQYKFVHTALIHYLGQSRLI